MTRWLMPSVGLLACLCLAGDETTRTLELGGPRQVKADVSATESAYVIKVRMRAVTVFDTTTNAQVNQDKARLYALQALARFLSDKPEVHLTITGAVVEETKLADKAYTLTLRVPRKGVAVVGDGGDNFRAPESKEKERRERVKFDSALFRARQDHEGTINQLSAALGKRVAELEKEDMTTPGQEDKNFVGAARELEDLGLRHLDYQRKAIETDRLLSSVSLFNKPSEQEELQDLIARHKEAWQKQVAEALARHKKKTKEKP